MTETAPKADTTTRTAERALTLLSVVCEKGSVTLGEAAKAADLSASTALRLLRTLESTNFVRRDDDAATAPGPPSCSSACSHSARNPSWRCAATR